MAYEKPEGLSEEEWRQFLSDIEKQDACLRDLVCPDCGSPLMKSLDPRQSGGTLHAGTWFNYRCTNRPQCKFLVDQCEPD